VADKVTALTKNISVSYYNTARLFEALLCLNTGENKQFMVGLEEEVPSLK
jgi:hypothetical protein